MGRAPLLLPLLGMVAGILLAEFCPAVSVGVIILVFIIGVSGAFLRPGTLPFLFIFLGVGWIVSYVHRPEPLPVTGLAYCSAEVLETRQTAGNAMFGIVSVDSVNGAGVPPFNISVEVIGHINVIYPGERIAFNSILERPDTVSDIPDVSFRNSSEIRYGVVGKTMILPDSLKFCGDARSFRASMARLNRNLSKRLSAANLNDESYALLSAMLLGNKSSINPTDVNVFSAAGLSHLLALSGTHVAVIITIISISLLPFAISRRKLPFYLLSILFLWGYAALTGLSPSVVRAVVMASVFMVGRMLERSSVPINSLCFAALLILFCNPDDLFMPGFQMSFAAVAGIIVFYPLFNCINRRKRPYLYLFWSYPALSLSAMVLTWSISAWYFHVFPFYFLLANLFAVPLMPFILGIGVFLLIFPQFDFFAAVENYLCGFLQWSAERVASLPDAIIADLYFPLWLTLALTILTLLIGVCIRYRKKAMAIACVMLLVFSVAANRIAPERFPEHESFVLDRATVVRHGDTVTVYARVRNAAECRYLSEYFSQRLRHYIGRRKIRNVVLEPQTDN